MHLFENIYQKNKQQKTMLCQNEKPPTQNKIKRTVYTIPVV
jgi:hypothetical protein